ncbi:MAG: hypothetical protein NVS2B14_20620 [Chamaesiphon sp.]
MTKALAPAEMPEIEQRVRQAFHLEFELARRRSTLPLALSP